MKAASTVFLAVIGLLATSSASYAFFGFGEEEEETLILRRSCITEEWEEMSGPVDKFRKAVKEKHPFQVSIELMPLAEKYDRKEVMIADRRFIKTVRGNPHIRLTRDFAKKGFQPYHYAMVDEEGFEILIKNMKVCGLREVPE